MIRVSYMKIKLANCAIKNVVLRLNIYLMTSVIFVRYKIVHSVNINIEMILIKFNRIVVVVQMIFN